MRKTTPHFFECILGQKPQKLKFDFDGDLEVQNEVWMRKLFRAVITSITSTFKEKYDIDLKLGVDLIVTDVELFKIGQIAPILGLKICMSLDCF